MACAARVSHASRLAYSMLRKIFAASAVALAGLVMFGGVAAADVDYGSDGIVALNSTDSSVELRIRFRCLWRRVPARRDGRRRCHLRDALRSALLPCVGGAVKSAEFQCGRGFQRPLLPVGPLRPGGHDHLCRHRRTSGRTATPSCTLGRRHGIDDNRCGGCRLVGFVGRNHRWSRLYRRKCRRPDRDRSRCPAGRPGTAVLRHAWRHPAQGDANVHQRLKSASATIEDFDERPEPIRRPVCRARRIGSVFAAPCCGWAVHIDGNRSELGSRQFRRHRSIR